MAAGCALLAGCGSAPAKPASQTVQGDGFQFQAPPSWRVTRTATTVAASRGSVERVEVLRFTLVRVYRPALFSKTTLELDAVIARLAGQLSGRVTSSATVRLASGPARSYRLVYGARTQQIAFVLQGPNEYELLCRRRLAQPEAPCQELLASFALASA